MLQFRDFLPKMLSPGGFLQAAEFDSFEDAAAAAGRWAANRGVRIINVETVVLPNLHAHYEEGSTDASIHTSGDMASAWNQFVRVWFEDADEA